MLEGNTDRLASRAYRDELEAALSGRVLTSGGDFCCTKGSQCEASVGTDGFAAGQLSYVGDNYAASSAGQALRVLVVSMQVGDDEAPVTMSRRREQIRTRIHEPFAARNQHMAGVTTALRVLFGGQPGADQDGELILTQGGSVHVLDAYAMANSVLCSRRPGAGRAGAPTKVMLANCSEHLLTTIKVLKPTVIQSQGRAASGSTHQAVEQLVDSIERLDDHVALVEIAGVEVVWCSLRHPARNWGQLGRSYLAGVALPALIETRRLAVGL